MIRAARRLPDEYEEEIAHLRATIDAERTRATRLERERDLAEARGRRWLRDALAFDDALARCIEHLDAEATAGRAGRNLYIYRRIRARLVEARDRAAVDARPLA